MKKDFKYSPVSLLIFSVVVWLVANGQALANSLDIVPGNGSQSDIMIGESVFARCLLKNRTETQCLIDCGNGEVISRRSGICKYNTAGTYTLVVKRIEHRREHSHIATVNVSAETVYARMRKNAPHQGGAMVIANPPATGNQTLVPNKPQQEISAAPNSLATDGLSTPPVVSPASSFTSTNTLSESFSDSAAATINTNNQTSFTNNLSNDIQNSLGINNTVQNRNSVVSR